MPPIDELVVGRPSSWVGMTIKWSSTSNPIPVFLDSFVTPQAAAADRVFLFGARYDLAEALVGGESLAPGYFVEFFVIRRGSNTWNLHRLLQRKSVTFSATDETLDYLDARSVNDPNKVSVNRAPHWKVSDAVWPTNRGVPMMFLGQVAPPETTLTRSLFMWGSDVFLFWDGRSGLDVFKLVQQDIGAQTADEHYDAEE